VTIAAVLLTCMPSATTFGTHLSKGGVPLRTAQAAMRHSKPDSVGCHDQLDRSPVSKLPLFRGTAAEVVEKCDRSTATYRSIFVVTVSPSRLRRVLEVDASMRVMKVDIGCAKNSMGRRAAAGARGHTLHALSPSRPKKARAKALLTVAIMREATIRVESRTAQHSGLQNGIIPSCASHYRYKTKKNGTKRY